MAASLARRAVVALTVWCIIACRTQATPGAGTGRQGPVAPQGVAAEQSAPAPPSASDSATAVRQQTARRLLAELGPRATMPAESVFTNIRILRGMPAGQVIRIMDGGFGRALGVTCSHCHDPSDWGSDAKSAKRIARGMWAMDRRANEELRGIPDVAPDAVINCTTCHAGRIKPVSNLR